MSQQKIDPSPQSETATQAAETLRRLFGFDALIAAELLSRDNSGAIYADAASLLRN